MLTVAPTPEYAFRHPSMREVAYRSQLDEERARRHAAVARSLERLRVDRLDEQAALIAHHWEASGVRSQAARWKRRAALMVSTVKVRGPGTPAAVRPRRNGRRTSSIAALRS